jgi:hypothetical protein
VFIFFHFCGIYRAQSCITGARRNAASLQFGALRERRFAAEVWVMPEDEPSQVSNRAAARGAKEGSTVVSTVKGTGVAKALVSGRRFAAEEWVMPEDGPSQVSIRAAARFWLWSLNSSRPLGAMSKLKKCNFILISSMDETN